jgi:membrane-bound lytic murein transglycosylase B
LDKGRIVIPKNSMTTVSTFVSVLSFATLVACSSGEGPVSTSGALFSNEAYAASSSGFERFIEGLRAEAAARGVSKTTFNAAFKGVTLDASVVALTKKQSEFVQPIWSYVNSAASPSRIETGRIKAGQWAQTLAKIEQTYGVPRTVVLGIWGMETGYGGGMGDKYVIRSLASLAHVGYRGDFFRNELLTALAILEQDHIDQHKMLGSWAGAMGHTQFMPTSFMQYSVDFDGDAKRDIWTSVPDALASTAHYLKQKGWQSGLPWGVEVTLPEKYSYTLLNGSFSQFAAQGVKKADGNALPTTGEARLFFPAGHKGPAFLLTKNFDVIKEYNMSDAYALGVAHLGDRIAGGGGLIKRWPLHQPILTRDQTIELQQRLMKHGYDVGNPDGKIGSKTREAVRQTQQQLKMIPDGFPTLELLNKMKNL